MHIKAVPTKQRWHGLVSIAGTSQVLHFLPQARGIQNTIQMQVPCVPPSACGGTQATAAVEHDSSINGSHMDARIPQETMPVPIYLRCIHVHGMHANTVHSTSWSLVKRHGIEVGAPCPALGTSMSISCSKCFRHCHCHQGMFNV